MGWIRLIGLLLAVTEGIPVNGKEKWEQAFENGTRWILEQRRPNFGWKYDGISRALIALKEAGSATGCWDPQSLEAQLSTKQLELELMQKLWQRPKEVKANEIMLYSMALTAMCHDPSDFYGTNLLALLQNGDESEHPFTFAFRTLAICAGRGDMKPNHVERLVDISKQSNNASFFNDTLAMVSIALTCVDNDPDNTYNLEPLIRNNLATLASRQNPDGSFGIRDNVPGNLATTAIIMQALSMRKNLSEIWRREAALNWLVSMQTENGSFEEVPQQNTFFMTTEALLALSGTGYGHISLSSCNPPPSTELPATTPIPREQAGITYTLWFYPNISYVRTLNLVVPVNESFYEVTKTAAHRDPAFKFGSTHYYGSNFVHTIGQLSAVNSMAWLLYRTPTFPDPKCPPLANYMTSGLDSTFVQDGDHFLFWYRDTN